jgi:dCMP deaminase
MDRTKFFLNLTFEFAKLSKDPSTKVGALIIDQNYRILAYGYNGFPRKFEDNYSKFSREEKNLMTVHAEMNAILNAAANGVSCSGAYLFCTHQPCSHCAAAIVNAGIVKVIIPYSDTLSSDWNASVELSKEILYQCGVNCVKSDY